MMKNLKKQLVQHWPLSLVVATIVLLLLVFLVRPNTAPAPVAEQSWSVAVRTIQLATLTPAIELYGRLESPQVARLQSPSTAYVVQTPVREGQIVKKGDLLVRLDDRDARYLANQRRAEVEAFDAQIKSERIRAQADKQSLVDEQRLLDLKQKTVEREQHLFKKGVGSKQRYEDAEQALRQQALSLNQRQLAVSDHEHRLSRLMADRAKAQALFLQAELDLSRTQIRAPFSGRVTRIAVSTGDRVAAGSVLAELFDQAAVELRAQLPSQYIGLVQNSLAKQQTLMAQAVDAGRILRFKLDRLAGQLGAGRASVDALFVLTDSEKSPAHLTLGRTLKLTLFLPPLDGVFALPSSALYNNNTLYKVVDGRMQAVTAVPKGVLIRDDAPRERIFKSPHIQSGDRVVITALPQAISGQRVTATEAP